MFLSRDEDAVKKVRFWATQARDPAPHYQHSEIGYNYRMSNIVAGIGRGQLPYLDEHIRRKREIYTTYKKYFKRPLDIICSLLALIILSPVLLITAMLVRRTSKYARILYYYSRETKGSKFMFYWNHFDSGVRSGFKLGFTAFMISLASLVISILPFVIRVI